MEFHDDYSDSSDGYNYQEEEDEDNDVEEISEGLSKIEIDNYTSLTEADIRRLQEDAIAEACSVLSVPPASAIILLLHHRWNISRLHDAWFADEEGVRKAVGLPEPPSSDTAKANELVNCGICFDEYKFQSLRSANCCHFYCKECWKSYVESAVDNGSGCLIMRCPEPSCHAAVGQDLIDSVASKKHKLKYAGYLARSYVELSRKTRWCPAPGCKNAVKFIDGGGYDVYCNCTYGFCWNCDEEAHSPMDCTTVKKWITKNTSDSMTTAWIMVNSKPCPACNNPIEKNHGCMHMTCRPPCGHQFCWICLGDWKTHKHCNGYKTNSDDERKRKSAKKALVKYTHYYERYAANHKSWKRSLDDLKKVQTKTLNELSEVKGVPVEELSFIVDAWKQVVECRGVLKWTYAYGYYLPENEKTKKQFFEYVQGEAEGGLERLHDFAEEEVKKQLIVEFDLDEFGNEVIEDEFGDFVRVDKFNDFRSKLIGLTRVTRTYFAKLVTALENRLPDVVEGALKSKNAKNC